jgi:hypothetical protein
MVGITMYRFMRELPCKSWNLKKEDVVGPKKTLRKEALYVGLNASMETVQVGTLILFRYIEGMLPPWDNDALHPINLINLIDF